MQFVAYVTVTVWFYGTSSGQKMVYKVMRLVRFIKYSNTKTIKKILKV